TLIRFNLQWRWPIWRTSANKMVRLNGSWCSESPHLVSRERQSTSLDPSTVVAVRCTRSRGCAADYDGAANDRDGAVRLAGRATARLPGHIGLPAVIGEACSREQQIRETIQIDRDVRVDGLGLGEPE